MICTPRLILRDFQHSDLDAYCRLRAHEDFQQFYSPRDVSAERSGELLHEFQRWSTENPRLRFQLAIEERRLGLLGSCGLRITDADQGQAFFGCELGWEYWGHGYAIEAASALIGYGFAELRVHRVVAETLAENRSALARRLGMRVEGRHRESRHFRNRWWDTMTLAILSSEWEG